jgi:hypothetical protein
MLCETDFARHRDFGLFEIGFGDMFEGGTEGQCSDATTLDPNNVVPFLDSLIFPLSLILSFFQFDVNNGQVWIAGTSPTDIITKGQDLLCCSDLVLYLII